jgi:peptidoglycan/LPS O-acetylase OafA/YrhL
MSRPYALYDLNLRHRDDLQGLRAVAVLLVGLSHAGVAFLQGGYVGVDVFFVLSGFLITGLLLTDAARRGRVSLSEFYWRRARRILPAAALTLVATDLVAYHLLNVIRARQAVSDSIWASVFAANVHFAREGTDYFAQWQPASPIQHFWTLAVEEQFYLVWPALVSVVLFGVALRRRHSQSSPLAPQAVRRLLFIIVAAAVGSFAWSVHYTSANPAAAYFSTFARAWELALGAALAIVSSRIATLRIASMRGMRAITGCVGLICICCAAVLFSPRTLFPGYAALLPAVGAALVIAAGIGAEAPAGVGKLLALRPFCYVGDRSYALYLWHWPVLIIAVQYEGHDLSVPAKLLLLAAAFLLSIITYKLFENPIRHMRLPAPAPVGVLMWPASAAIVLLIALLTLGSIDGRIARLSAASAGAAPAPLRDPLAAATLTLVNSKTTAPLPAVVAAVRAAQRGAPLPSPLTPPVGKLLHDTYSFPAGCAPDTGDTQSQVCKLGDTMSSKTLVVMGDSFVQQWMPAVLTIAQQDAWTVVPLVNGSGCSASGWLKDPRQPWCHAWYTWALGQAKLLHPDVVMIAGELGPDSPPRAATGAIALISAAKRFSKIVIVIGVPPFQTREPVDCLLAPHATMKTCTSILRRDPPNELKLAAFVKKHRVGFIDPKGWFCARPSARKSVYWCPLVVNRTITRRDVGHVTVAYVTQLAPSFRAAFRRELFR